MKIAAGNAMQVDAGEAVSAGSSAARDPAANFASFLDSGAGGSVVSADTVVSGPVQAELKGAAAEGVAPVSVGVMYGKTASIGSILPTTPADDEIGRGGEVHGAARSKAAGTDVKDGPKKQSYKVASDSSSIAEGSVQTHSQNMTGAALSLGLPNAGLALQARSSTEAATDDGSVAKGSLRPDSALDIFGSTNSLLATVQERSALPAGDDGSSEAGGTESLAGVGEDVGHAAVAVPQAEPQRTEENSSVTALAQVEPGKRTVLDSTLEGVDGLRQTKGSSAMDFMSQKNPRDSAHEMSQGVDKPYMSLESTVATPLAVASPAPSVVRSGYVGGHEGNAVADASSLQDVDRGSETTTVSAAVPVFTSNGKDEARDGLNSGADRAASSASSASLQAGVGVVPSPFGVTLAGEAAATSLAERTRAQTQHPAVLSSSDESALERLQTAGATRALGSALQSSMGLGVQTESFGRVTIHTAAEGTQLRAEVTLEDGRQSATLISHVPAVEHRLMQKLGLDAAVRVTAEGTSSPGGGVAGDRGRGAPQSQRDESHARIAGENAGRGGETEAVAVAGSMARSGVVSPGRLDITV